MLKNLVFTFLLLATALIAEVVPITSPQMLKDITKNSDVVVVDYYADWCGPCKLLGPLLADLSKEYTNNVTFVKVNVDQQRQLASEANIRSIPYVLFIKDGEIVHSQIGLLEKEQYQQIIDYIIAMAPIQPLYELTAIEFKEKTSDTSATIIDVRTRKEFNEGHIKGALLIPVEELSKRIHELDTYRESPIYLYCRSGHRSEGAGQILTQAGFTQVYHLSQGIKSWISAGYPVEKP